MIFTNTNINTHHRSHPYTPSCHTSNPIPRFPRGGGIHSVKLRPSRVHNSRNATLRVHILYFDLNSVAEKCGWISQNEGKDICSRDCERESRPYTSMTQTWVSIVEANTRLHPLLYHSHFVSLGWRISTMRTKIMVLQHIISILSWCVWLV